MENRAHALAAGLFTLLLGAALVAVALWFSKGDLKLIPYAITTLSPVTGLKVEAPVRYRGVDVGKVDAISIDTANGGRVQIRIGVREGTPITKSTYAQLGFQGITGLAYVQLGDDGTSLEALRSSSEAVALIRLKPSLLDDAEKLLGTFGEITGQVKQLLDAENQGHVRRTLAGLEEVTQRASVAAKKLEPSLVAMPGLISEAKSMASEAKNMAADARGSLRKADELIGSVNGLALKLDERVDTITQAVVRVEEVGVTARAMGEETVPRVNVLIDDLSRETNALGRVINTVGDHPQSVLFGTPPGRPGPGEPGFAGGR